MTAVMVPAAGGSGSGTTIAKNNRGRAVVPGSSTVTLVSFVAGTHRLRGFQVEGEGDGFVWIEIDGTPWDGLAARKTVAKDAYRILPNPEAYPTSSTIVALKVTNSSTVASEFEGVVFGE
jgi:hypothetical protein